MEYHTVEKAWKVGADPTCRLPHCRCLLHTGQPAINQGNMEGRHHVDTRAWSIVDRLALAWSICLHQQAIPRDLDEHWLHCWPQQCQRTYPKHNVGKRPQPVLCLLVIAQETVTINLMILRDPSILQNRETRVTGPTNVVTLSDMQDQRQVWERPFDSPAGWWTWLRECRCQSPLQLPHVLPRCGVWSTTLRRPPDASSHPSAWRTEPSTARVPDSHLSGLIIQLSTTIPRGKFVGWTPLTSNFEQRDSNFTDWWHFFLLTSETTWWKWKCTSVK